MWQKYCCWETKSCFPIAISFSKVVFSLACPFATKYVSGEPNEIVRCRVDYGTAECFKRIRKFSQYLLVSSRHPTRGKKLPFIVSSYLTRTRLYLAWFSLVFNATVRAMIYLFLAQFCPLNRTQISFQLFHENSLL